ncbi:hypothetical protein [Hyphomicrobium sp.]|jgi:hypothetical protein|uniref:hypothetical protein n=1 Tax=Hyphomicrobium sp. TaxID=82 RepID=UPI002C7E0F01|nr:hypothetical protein [Hyphomicrobium sp.]HVZ05407.1 hypothetical protein [Hyphomicrobium sp.]
MAKRLGAFFTFLYAALWANSAWATCYFGFICLPGGGHGGPSPAPEIDVSGAFAAAAVLIAVGAIAYRRLRAR